MGEIKPMGRFHWYIIMFIVLCIFVATLGSAAITVYSVDKMHPAVKDMQLLDGTPCQDTDRVVMLLMPKSSSYVPVEPTGCTIVLLVSDEAWYALINTAADAARNTVDIGVFP